MGGDDLDDDLLWNQPVTAEGGSPLLLGDASDDDDDDDEGHTSSSTPVDDDDDDDNEYDKTPSKRKKETSTADNDDEPPRAKKKKLSPEQLLLQAGRNLEQQSIQEQATFLTTALKHYSLLEQQQQQKKKNGEKQDSSTAAASDQLQVLPRHFVTSDDNNGTSWIDRLRQVVSTNKLKHWNSRSCPYVLIVCISARRAVELLKELKPLKVRVAKLFPKNGSIAEQNEQLAKNSYSIAIGTPHRLRQVNLDLSNTQLVIVDCHVSHKQYTVCTLPDTAPHCMGLIRDVVLPQVCKRKDCKLAFL